MANRKHEKIPYSEIEPLLNLLKNKTGGSETEIMQVIGYSSGSPTAWRQEQQAPLRAKYSLLGLAAEMKVERPARSLFNHQELMALFAILIGIKVDEDQKRQIAGKIASELKL